LCVGQMLAERDEQESGGEGEEDGRENSLHGETPFQTRAPARPIAFTRMP
jgi:hypothetical protein